ncbi:MAG TPA: hypothetical protein VG537_08990 [Candidatus Kapabacteria bacterium]|nr:hypothetical protein [Candidatus Kapabacteria bacterium]
MVLLLVIAGCSDPSSPQFDRSYERPETFNPYLDGSVFPNGHYDAIFTAVHFEEHYPWDTGLYAQHDSGFFTQAAFINKLNDLVAPAADPHLICNDTLFPYRYVILTGYVPFDYPDSIRWSMGGDGYFAGFQDVSLPTVPRVRVLTPQLTDSINSNAEWELHYDAGNADSVKIQVSYSGLIYQTKDTAQGATIAIEYSGPNTGHITVPAFKQQPFFPISVLTGVNITVQCASVAVRIFKSSHYGFACGTDYEAEYYVKPE